MISGQKFEELRPYLFSLAYRMLGSAAEAEDTVQDAWLRTDKAPEDIDSERAWLSTVVTRLCLDRLKSAQMTREEYVGPWLPEPVASDAIPAPEASVLREESVTMAFLVLLEKLSPAERAAFLLREVFDYNYSEIAGILQASETAVRQMVHRSKERLLSGKPRFRPAPEVQRKVVASFLSALREGDLPGLESLLAHDATLTADGGGKVAAAKRVIEGGAGVAKLFAGIHRQAQAAAIPWRIEISELNGEPALLGTIGGQLDTVFIFTVEEDRIAAVQVVRNPEKLEWLRTRLQRAS